MASGQVGRFRVVLAAIALTALAVAVGVCIRGSHRAVLGNQSVATLAATTAAISLGLWAFWSATSEQRSATLLQAVIGFSHRRPAPIRRAVAGGVLLASALAFIAINAKMRRANIEPRDDQADYLSIAADIANRVGLRSFPGALWSGDFREDNRHPIYLAALAASPTFGFGVGISTAMAIATIVLAAVALLRSDGMLAAVLAAAFLAVNRALHDSAALVACETTLVFFVFAGWLCWTSERRCPSVWATLGGACMGLAYLTKASAFLLFVIGVVWLASTDRRSGNRVRSALLAAAAFTVVAMPLLVRNARVYGNPLHGYNNRLLLADDFEVGRAEPDLGWQGNWRRFRERHSWTDIVVRRIGHGLAMEAFVMLRSLGPWPFDSGRAPIGLAIASLALMAVVAKPRGMLLIGWVAVFWLFFAWYLPIAASDRFVLPLTPIIVAEASKSLARFMPGSRQP